MIKLHPKTVNLAGRRFGKLLVKEFAGYQQDSYGRKAQWLVTCDCGLEYIILASSLLRKNGTKGCISCGKTYSDARYSALTQIYLRYQRSASIKKISFLIPRDEFDKLVLSNCWYCKVPPSTLKIHGPSKVYYNGLDRVRNNIGYTLFNVVPCCWRCNDLKDKLSMDDLENILYGIYRFLSIDASSRLLQYESKATSQVQS